ncbi:MAG: type III pantothenate kinase [Candidatus Omnitrophica bacterium]|nr:type III pantothenate kinase [Candidatus Omnitrophota bacterium]
MVKQDLFLAIDIGNTTITLGLMKGQEVLRVQNLPTVQKAAALSKELNAALRKINILPADVVICSVVPSVLPKVCSAVHQVLGIRPQVIGKDILVPMINRYKNSRQVGQDRLVGAYAAMKLYGAPAVIVDLGTAITLDVVSRRGEYLGGIIVPGIQLSAEMLFQRTALLPMAKIQKPRTLVGRDTQGSILSGIFYGYGEMIQGLIGRLKKTVKGTPKVVLTGGYATLMKGYLQDVPSRIDPHLVLKGIAMILHFQK